MLGAVLPEMRTQAEALATDLVESAARAQGDRRREATGWSGDVAALGGGTPAHAAADRGAAEASRPSTRRRSTPSGSGRIVLARQADNLKDLIAKLEQGLDSATRAARAAATRRQGQATPVDLAALDDPGRLAPAVAFASRAGIFRFRLMASNCKEFGAPDGLGGTEKGLSIATRAGAQVTAPCDGWVVYAGPFRNYGQLLILNAGGGYHVVLAGMERISVDLGQFVLTGEPVAVMGNGSHIGRHPRVRLQPTGALRRVPQGRYPRRSSPWWAASEGEKVRG